MKLKILIFYLIFFFFIQSSISVYSEEIPNPNDIEQSEEYLKRKAKIKYEQRDNTVIRQISIGGIRVHDIYLVDILGDMDMKNRLLDEQNKRRITYAVISGLSVPVGGYLVALANSRLSSFPANSSISNNSVSFDISTFFLGTGGTILTIFGVMYGIYLLNDLTGLDVPAMLTDKEAEELVLKYNQQLRDELIKKQEMNSLSNYLPLVGINLKF